MSAKGPLARARVRAYLHTHPFSVTAAASYVIAALVFGPFGRLPSALRQHLGVSLGGHRYHWWTPVTGTFLTMTVVELAVAVVGSIVLLGAAERLMGWRRTAIAFFVTAVAGIALGAGAILAGSIGHVYWARHIAGAVTVDPQSGIFGALMTASAFAGPLWRRRIRVTAGLGSVLFVLYAGLPVDIYRAASAVCGLALGIVLARSKIRRGWARSSQHESRVLLAAVTAMSALGPLVAVASARMGPLAPIGLLIAAPEVPGPRQVAACNVHTLTHACLQALAVARAADPGTIAVSALPLLGMLLAAWGMLHGRRFAAWYAGVISILLGLAAAVYFGVVPVARAATGGAALSRLPPLRNPQIVTGLLLSILVPIAVGIAIIALRRRFPNRVEATQLRRYLGTVGLAVVIVCAGYVAAAVTAPRGTFTRAPGLGMLLVTAPARLLPVGMLGHRHLLFLPLTPWGHLLFAAPGAIVWLVIVLAALPPLFSSRSLPQAARGEQLHALLRQGGDTRSYMTSWAGNRYWFSADGSHAVAFRVVGRIALTTGGPIGSVPPRVETLTAFARYCDDNGWTPVFYAVDQALGPAFRALRWHTTSVGEEAVIRTDSWTTSGKKMNDVRTAINRAARDGVRSRWTSWAALPLNLTTQLEQISEEWVAGKELPEMGFTLGGIDEVRDPQVRLMIATDAADRVLAFTSWLPAWRDGRQYAWTLDVMRRRRDAPNGIMEFLIASVAEQAKAEGVPAVSLSAAPLAQGSAANGASSGLDTALDYLAERLEPIYGFRSLQRFKRKFQPQTSAVIMAYHDPVSLPEVGLALVRAYLPTLTVRQAATLAFGRRTRGDRTRPLAEATGMRGLG